SGSNGTAYYFAMLGAASNWVESYAMVRPLAQPATNINSSSFTANWQAPTFGNVNNYLFDVSYDANFTSTLAGYSNLLVNGLSTQVSSLVAGTYYYRVRANRTTMPGTGAPSQIGTFTVAATAPGNALRFDGTDDLVVFSNTLGNTGTSDFTYETWVRTTINSTIFHKRTACAYGNFVELKVASGKVLFEINETSVANYTAAYGTSIITDSLWHHVAIVRAGTNILVYVDGILESTTALNGNPSIGNSANFTLGVSPCGNWYNGSLDEFRMYNTALSASNIQADMISSTAAVPSSLLLYCNFDNGVPAGSNSGQLNLPDFSSQGNSGTLQNFGLTGGSSNWVESYAMVNLIQGNITNLASSGFKVQWTKPAVGTVSNYLLDISTSSTFQSMIAGFNGLQVTDTFYTVTGLGAGRFYVRVRANKTSVSGQGNPSNVKEVVVSIPKPGNALHFDGVDDHVVLPVALGNVGFSNFSISVWIRTTGNGTIFHKRGACNFGNFIQLGISSGKAIFEINQSNASDYTAVSSTSNVNTGRWTQILVRRTGTSLDLFINGKLEKTVTIVGSPNISNSTPFTLGISPCGGWFSGSMDEFSIYGTALTDAEIASLVHSNLPSLTGSLVGYYNFDLATASGSNTGYSTLVDSSSNRFDGTLVNFSLTGGTSNWVESYSQVLPTIKAATYITSSSFTANWEAPITGTVQAYELELSAVANFATLVSSNSSISANSVSFTFNGLTPGKYYYRLRAVKTGIASHGAFVDTIQVIELPAPGNALNFDGLDDYMFLPHNNSYNISAFTIEAWVLWNPTNSTDIQFLTSKGSEQWEIHFGSSANGVRFIPVPGVFLDASTKFQTGVWTHLACVYNPSTLTGKIYINGVDANAVNNGTAQLSTPIPTNNSAFFVGMRSSVSYPFKGSIDEMKIYNYARTASEISNSYMLSSPPINNSIISYFKFDQGAAGGSNTAVTTVTDYS
ncbi:MAG: hypothetical protein EAY68_09005, partial [Bacteroidetes bacterium]